MYIIISFLSVSNIYFRRHHGRAGVTAPDGTINCGTFIGTVVSSLRMVCMPVVSFELTSYAFF